MSFAMRLRQKWLWYRHMWPVLWAHKPLCEPFRHDVLHIGMLYVCRSCACVLAGFFSVSLLLLTFHKAVAPALLIPALVVTLALSAPPIYCHLPRAARDVLRFATGALVAMTGYTLLTANWVLGAGSLLALLVVWRAYLRWRTGSNTDPCQGCPHFETANVCPGYALQADHFRAYESEAAGLLQAYGPSCW